MKRKPTQKLKTRGAVSKKTPARMRAFLAHLERDPRATVAAKVGAGVTYQTVWNWAQADPEFERAWQEAIRTGDQLLEDEAFRRAYYGVKRPVYQGGKLCCHVTDYSDHLMVILLRARLPQKYRENLNVSGGMEFEYKGKGLSALLAQCRAAAAQHEAEELAARKQGGSWREPGPFYEVEPEVEPSYEPEVDEVFAAKAEADKPDDAEPVTAPPPEQAASVEPEPATTAATAAATELDPRTAARIDAIRAARKIKVRKVRARVKPIALLPAPLLQLGYDPENDD